MTIHELNEQVKQANVESLEKLNAVLHENGIHGYIPSFMISIGPDSETAAAAPAS